LISPRPPPDAPVSKAWKFSAEFFQALENLVGFFPRFGKFQIRTPEKVCEFAVRDWNRVSAGFR
jgi:hypothetical protein